MMFQKIVFSVLCAFVMPPILMPGDKVDMVESALTCPSGSTTDDEPDTETPLEKKIYSQARNAKRLKSFTESGDIYIRMDAESLYCYERDEQVMLESYVTLWWQDKFICWNPADFDNVDNVTIKSKYLWSPRLISYTKSIESFRLQYRFSDCIVYSNGTVTCRTILYITGNCKMYLRNWPTASHAECWISLEVFNPTGRQKLLHRDDRPGYEWLHSANTENPGQFAAVNMRMETAGNGVVYRFLFLGTTPAFAHAVTTVAGVLSLVLFTSFGIPAGSSARISLLGCVCVSLLLSIGFLGSQLTSVTPDTPIIVRLHGGILIIAAIALIPATLLAPRSAPTKPCAWQLRLRSFLLNSSAGRFLLLIFRVSNPSEGIAALGDDGEQSTSFQKDDSGTSNSGDDPTRTLLFILTDRVLAAICCVSLIALWIAMLFDTDDSMRPFTYFI